MHLYNSMPLLYHLFCWSLTCFQFLEYHHVYTTGITSLCTTAAQGKSTASSTVSASSLLQTFGMSCCLVASQMHCTQEIENGNPYSELNRYISDALEPPGTDILEFWKVYLLNSQPHTN